MWKGITLIDYSRKRVNSRPEVVSVKLRLESFHQGLTSYYIRLRRVRAHARMYVCVCVRSRARACLRACVRTCAIGT